MVIRKLSLVILFMNFGCATVGLTKGTEINLQKVRTGMSEQDIISVLGAPNSRTMVMSDEVWRYRLLSRERDRERPYKFIFHENVLTNVQFDTAEVMGDKYIPPGTPTNCGIFNCGETIYSSGWK